MEISTERGANILFLYKCIHRTKVLEGRKKNVDIFAIPPQLRFLMPMIQFTVLHDIVKKKKCMIHGPCGTSQKRTLHQVYRVAVDRNGIRRNLNISNKGSYSQI